jgi:hypothetical protein
MPATSCHNAAAEYVQIVTGAGSVSVELMGIVKPLGFAMSSGDGQLN